MINHNGNTVNITKKDLADADHFLAARMLTHGLSLR
jgi:hypothetical protein